MRVHVPWFMFPSLHKLELFVRKNEARNSKEGRINVAEADGLIESSAWFKPGMHATIWRPG